MSASVLTVTLTSFPLSFSATNELRKGKRNASWGSSALWSAKTFLAWLQLVRRKRHHPAQCHLHAVRPRLCTLYKEMVQCWCMKLQSAASSANMVSQAQATSSHMVSLELVLACSRKKKTENKDPTQKLVFKLKTRRGWKVLDLQGLGMKGPYKSLGCTICKHIFFRSIVHVSFWVALEWTPLSNLTAFMCLKCV